MKTDITGYFNLLSDNAVVDCGNNHSFYKVKTLKAELSDFSDNTQCWIHTDNRLHKFATVFQSKLKEHKKIDLQSAAFSMEGIDAEIIDPKLDKPIKGKFRIVMALEFIPDESEGLESSSPLDEIRREMQG